MSSFYVYPPTPNEIYHYGVKRRSGRYPYGSGERPYQGEDVKRLREQQRLAERSSKSEYLAKKNLEIGRQRLENRKRVANVEVDRLSRNVGWMNTERAAAANKKMSEIKKTTDEILSSEERTRVLGDYTRRLRNTIVPVTAIASAASYGTASVFLGTLLGGSAATCLALPVIPAAAIGIAGYNYYQHTKY